MKKIRPCLWFDDKAEDAARFYVSMFSDAALGEITHYGEGAPRPKGSVLSVTFRLADEEFLALNGGPHFSLTPAISMFVTCTDQQELDGYWDRLSDGGKPMQCGWITDRFGVTWQIVPEALHDLLHDPDRTKSAAVMRAMLQMVKLDIAALRQAHAQA